jgi:hypothetical protein
MSCGEDVFMTLRLLHQGAASVVRAGSALPPLRCAACAARSLAAVCLRKALRDASLCASDAADRLSRSAVARSRPADVAAASSCAAARAARRRDASAASSASACSSSSRRLAGRPLSYGGSSYGSASPSYRSCAHASRTRGGDPPRGWQSKERASEGVGASKPALRPLRPHALRRAFMAKSTL